MAWRAGTEDSGGGRWRAGTEDSAPYSGGITVAITEAPDTWQITANVHLQAVVHIDEAPDVWTINANSSIAARVMVVEAPDVWSIVTHELRTAELFVVEDADVWSIDAHVIPLPPSPYDIWKVDAAKLICDRTLPLLHNAPVLRSVQSVVVENIDELMRALWFLLRVRTLPTSVGVWLEIIGRIVGVYPRPTLDAGDITYFTPDNVLGGPDLAPVYVDNAPLADQIPADDGSYQTQITARIFRNHIRHGSVPEIKQWIRIAYGVDSSIRRLGSSSVRIIVPDSTPAWLVEKLASYTTNDDAEMVYHVPLPAGTLLESVVTVSGDV